MLSLPCEPPEPPEAFTSYQSHASVRACSESGRQRQSWSSWQSRQVAGEAEPPACPTSAPWKSLELGLMWKLAMGLELDMSPACHASPPLQQGLVTGASHGCADASCSPRLIRGRRQAPSRSPTDATWGRRHLPAAYASAPAPPAARGSLLAAAAFILIKADDSSPWLTAQTAAEDIDRRRCRHSSFSKLLYITELQGHPPESRHHFSPLAFQKNFMHIQV